MANELTGDFDVVAEFSLPGVNRLLAAMHRAGRFSHSIAIRVDDVPSHPGTFDPSIVGVVDAFGDTVSDHTAIPPLFPGHSINPGTLSSALGLVVNVDLAGIQIPPIVPSNIRGRAQLQMGPPTIEVPDTSGTNITVRLEGRSRYLPDPGGAPLAEFLHWVCRVTAGTNQVVSQAANLIEVDLRADNTIVNFLPVWSSGPLSAEDLAAIRLLIRNALKTSFLPTSANLPTNIKHLQFKTLAGTPDAIGVLLNMSDFRGSPASMNGVFLGAGDAFAFAAGKEFILASFDQTLSEVAGQESDVAFTIDWPWPVPNQHAVYTITLNSASVDLEPGKIVLTIEGHAVGNAWNLPNFDFKVRQNLTLTLDGATAEIVPAGDPTLDITSGLIDSTLIGPFKSRVIPSIRQERDKILSDSRSDVRRMLNAGTILGNFLNSLLNPAIRPQNRGQETLQVSLAYTSFEIRAAGIVLRGTLTVPNWPAAHVEFERIANDSTGIVSESILQEPEYSALKAWIPGGSIQRFEWKHRTDSIVVDEHRFVFRREPVISAFAAEASKTGPIAAFAPICLTLRGTRLASSGPLVQQPVTATFCGFTSFPLVDQLLGVSLMVALARPSPRGLVEVAGHVLARQEGAGEAAPSRIVHFADEKTAHRLEFLMQAVRKSGREFAAAVLVVLAPDQLAEAPYVEGLIYAEDQGSAWERAFKLEPSRKPLTLIVGPKGRIAWQHHGAIDSDKLAAALREYLPAEGLVRPRLLRTAVRVGRPSPNFVFQHAAGRMLTLRKLDGRAAVLVFWKSSAKSSVETVRELQATAGKGDGPGPVLLAVNDGEAPDLAQRFADANGLTAIIVPDPRRMIARAYGVSVWPTTVFIDALGLVREVHSGRFDREHPEYSGTEQQMGVDR